MLLSYSYKGHRYKVFIQWTADTGCSTVFQSLVNKVSITHRISPICYCEMAKDLDKLVDTLYGHIKEFNNEHHGVPYNPRFRPAILRTFSEIDSRVKDCWPASATECDEMLPELFINVVDKLLEIVNVYLDDSVYQSKFRSRKREKEGYIETTDETLLSVEFEDVLVQMTDLSCLMDCLSEKQRERLVLHTFMKYTMQEIADAENTTHQAVSQSISAALKKLRARLSK